ncbi:recombinase family protein [Candidatus Pristimantibacillus sp. PTI5]|uniref:recombinase family protein n=1 Tax=Candidatus Pristimantibacillus sp. PTI5 TaxID=3400422 RepID=UPI003B024F1B
MEKIKVAAYCRVSTDSADQINSLENQRSFFQNHIEKNETYDMHEIYADPGITGTSWKKRTEFMRMLKDAGLDIDPFKGELIVTVSKRDPLFNRILIKDVSRFARNLDTVDIFRKLRDKGVHLDFITLNKTTADVADDFFVSLLLLFAEQESKDKSEKVIFGHNEAAKKGVVKTSRRIFGFDYIKESNSLEIIPHEAEIIRLIFNLYNQGIGMRRILQHLEENGHRTRDDKPFVQSSINRFLTNEKYMGTLISNKFNAPRVFTNRKYSTVRSKDDWIVHENSHKIQPIISKETFEAAQRMRESKINYQKSKGKNKGTSEYAGLLVCGKCGGTYTRNIDRKVGVRIFYNCRTKKTKGKAFCDNVNIDLKQIEQLLYNLQESGFYFHFFGNRSHATMSLEIMINDLKNKIDTDKAVEVTDRKLELADTRKQLSRLANLLLEERIDLVDHDELRTKLKAKAQDLEVTIEALSKSNDEIKEEIELLEEMQDALDKIEIKLTYSKDEVKNGINRIIVNPNKPYLQVEFKIFDAINSVVKRHKDLEIPNWLHSFE